MKLAFKQHKHNISYIYCLTISMQSLLLNFISYFQSNHEGAIIDELQRIGYDYDAIILNAGGLTHTSIVMGDCVKAISAPVVEVHISNIQEREKYRNHSYVTAPSVHFIHGKGIRGYQIAIDWVIKNL